MGELENNFLLLIGILAVCYVLSIVLYKKKKVHFGGAFGYKCMNNSLGPNQGYCLKVNEAPNKDNGVYSDAISCLDACSKQQPQPQNNSFGYKCMNNILGPNQGYCLKVNEVPNKDNDVYSDAISCLDACSKQQPQPEPNMGGAFGFKCFNDDQGNRQCLKVNEAPNKENNVFSNAEECAYNCKMNKNVGKKGWACTEMGGCVPVDIAPNKLFGIFESAEECAYNCNPTIEKYQDDCIECTGKCLLHNSANICEDKCRDSCYAKKIK